MAYHSISQQHQNIIALLENGYLRQSPPDDDRRETGRNHLVDFNEMVADIRKKTWE